MECVNCKEGFNQSDRIPRLLTKCGHSICEKCIHSFWNQQEYSYTCRVCSALNCAQIISQFPKNLAIMSLAHPSHSSSSQFTQDLQIPVQYHHNLSSNYQSHYNYNQKYQEDSLQPYPSQLQPLRKQGQESHMQSQNEFANTSIQSFQYGHISTAHTMSLPHQTSVNASLNAGQATYYSSKQTLQELNGNIVMKNSDQNSICSNHTKQFEAFCLFDKQFLCVQCILEANGKHKHHTVETIEKAVQIEIQKLFEFDQHLAQTKKEHQQTRIKIQSAKTEIFAIQQQITEDISSFYNIIIKSIKERELSQMQKLKDERQVRSKILEEMDKCLENNENQIRIFLETKHRKIDEYGRSLSCREYLEKVSEIDGIRNDVLRSLEKLEENKGEKKWSASLLWGFEFNKQSEIQSIQKSLNSGNIIQSQRGEDNLTLINAQKIVQLTLPSHSSSTTTLKKATPAVQFPFNIGQKLKESNSLHQHSFQDMETAQKPIQLRKHSKTLQTPSLNLFPLSATQTPATPKTQTPSSILPSNNNPILDASKYKLEIKNKKVLNRHSSQPKKYKLLSSNISSLYMIFNLIDQTHFQSN